MHIVRVQRPGDYRDVQEGESLGIGRGTTDGTVFVVGSHPRLHRTAARLSVLADAWLLENVGGRLEVRVVSDDGLSLTDLPPGRLHRSQDPSALVEIVIIGSEAARFELRSNLSVTRSTNAAPIRTDTDEDSVDRTARYFATLVLLCEPRFEDRFATLPSDHQISADLRRLGLDASMTGRKVGRDLRRARERLELVEYPAGLGAGREHPDARSQLADLAIRTGVVTRSDIAVLRSQAAQRG